ncbi:contact-dependent growth inhibition system immunity protein [Pantoea sp.]|uniref:contact-dependent growth inhibition system immunity protein n=1 Tax=Pantoea sp. TaxID=69393 RepID=UPI0031D18A77
MQNYPNLDQLIFGYFNQDADLINEGETSIEGIIGLYKKHVSDAALNDLVIEVDAFIAAHGQQLESVFAERYESDFSPKLWETSALEFLLTVRDIAAEEQ